MAYDETHIGNEIYDTQYECPYCGCSGTDYEGFCVNCGEQVVLYDEPEIIYAVRNAPNSDDGSVVVNLVLGLLSIALGTLGLVFGFIPVVLGMFIAIVSMFDGMPNNGMTKALSTIGLVLNIACLGFLLYQLLNVFFITNRIW